MGSHDSHSNYRVEHSGTRQRHSADNLVSEHFQCCPGQIQQRIGSRWSCADRHDLTTYFNIDGKAPTPPEIGTNPSSSRTSCVTAHKRNHGELSVTPFQDYLALGAACAIAALLFATTPAHSTKSGTHLQQATTGAMLSRSSKDSRTTCAGNPGAICASAGSGRKEQMHIDQWP